MLRKLMLYPRKNFRFIRACPCDPKRINVNISEVPHRIFFFFSGLLTSSMNGFFMNLKLLAFLRFLILMLRRQQQLQRKLHHLRYAPLLLHRCLTVVSHHLRCGLQKHLHNLLTCQIKILAPLYFFCIL